MPSPWVRRMVAEQAAEDEQAATPPTSKPANARRRSVAPAWVTRLDEQRKLGLFATKEL